MRISICSAVVVTIALAGLAACDQSPTATRSDAPAPAFGFEQGPTTPGASPVFRMVSDGEAGWIILVDADSELASLTSGIDGIRSGDDIAQLCPGEDVNASNPLPFQSVTTRSGVANVLGTGDLFTWVYDVSGLLPPGFPDVPLGDGPSLFFDCDFLTGDAMVAEGVVQSLQTVSSSPGGRQTINATGTGRLDDLVNGDGQVSANIKLFVHTDADGDFVRAPEVIVTLNPDPRF